MKIKNYVNLWAMSLFVLSMDQLQAAWRKPLIGAGGVVGANLMRYYPQNSTSQQINVSVNPVVYPKSTDFNTYSAMTGNVYTQQLPKSTYPQKQSSELAKATEKLEQFVVDQLKQELDTIKKENAPIQVQNIKYSQLKTEQQKLQYLKNEFKEFTIVDDAFLHLVINLFNNEMPTFKNNEVQINQFVESNITWFKWQAHRKSGIVSVDIWNEFIESLDFSLIGSIIELLFSNPMLLKFVAYHEGAHALVMALVVESSLVYNAINMSPTLIDAGHIVAASRYPTEHELQAMAIDQKSFGALHALQLDAQNLIMVHLAGIIGEMIGEGKEKISFKDYLVMSVEYGGGDRADQGSDIHSAYQVAESYIRWKNFTRISKYQNEPDLDEADFQQEVDDFIEESYEKAYALLMKNRDKLDLMANAIDKKRIIYMDEIYSIADVPRSKLDSEFTFAEQFKQDFWNWFVWTAERIKFYEKQYPQA